MALQSRDRRALTFLGVAIALVLAYLYGVEPLVRGQQQLAQDIAARREQLLKYQQVVARRKPIEQQRQKIAAVLKQLGELIFVGDKPSLAAAELQQVLKELARREGVKIEREKILEPIEAGNFQQILVEINVRSSVRNISRLIYQIEGYAKFLAIPEFSIEVANRRKPSTVKARLVVTGLLWEPESTLAPPQQDRVES